MRQLLSIDDLSRDEILALTASLPLQREPEPQLLRGTLAFLFQQPSLRTMSSFARAGVHLGLAPVVIPDAGSGVRSRCDLEDEIHQLTLTSSCVVVRLTESLDREALERCEAPIVNAGDGANEHPTQALVDLAAMRTFGLQGKRVVLMGNLRDHRVHHSLAKALRRLGVAFTAVCAPGFEMGTGYLGEGEECVRATSSEEVDEVLHTADFVYLTPSASFVEQHLEERRAYSLDLARVQRVFKPGAKIVHPFPRLGELANDLDGTEYDGYQLTTRLGWQVRYRVLRWLIDRVLPRASASSQNSLPTSLT